MKVLFWKRCGFSKPHPVHVESLVSKIHPLLWSLNLNLQASKLNKRTNAWKVSYSGKEETEEELQNKRKLKKTPTTSAWYRPVSKKNITGQEPQIHMTPVKPSCCSMDAIWWNGCLHLFTKSLLINKLFFFFKLSPDFFWNDMKLIQVKSSALGIIWIIYSSLIFYGFICIFLLKWCQIIYQFFFCSQTALPFRLLLLSLESKYFGSSGQNNC